MMSLLLLTALAHAEESIMDMAPCGVWPSITAPAAGQADVAVDVVPAVIFDGCGGDAEFSLELRDVADEALLGSATYHFSEGGNVFAEVVPDRPLTAQHAYHLVVLDESAFAVADVGFTTGTGEVLGLDGAPDVNVEEAEGIAVEGFVQVELEVMALVDPDNLSLLLVSDEGSSEVVLRGAAPSQGGSTFLFVSKAVEGELPEEWCLEVAQRDGAGVRYPTESFCVPLNAESEGGKLALDCGGCGSEPVPTTRTDAAALAGLGTLFFWRRRKGRG
jgi:MYXO-CTERM domain-containing protein